VKKSRTLVTTLALILIAAFTPALASADTKSPSTSPSSENNISFKVAMEKFKQDQKIFLDALKAYHSARRAINKAFKESVDKALSDAKSLSAPGQTQLQKRQSAVVKQSAVITATAIRDAAIEALGPAPVPPTPPVKSQRMEKSKKPKPSASPREDSK
jgi:hypothetical protein